MYCILIHREVWIGVYAYWRWLMNEIDLNYRMDIPDEEMRKTLKEDGWENGSKFETLLRFDQVSSSYFLSPYQSDSYPLLT